MHLQMYNFCFFYFSEEVNVVTPMDEEVKGSWADAAEQSENNEERLVLLKNGCQSYPSSWSACISLSV